MRSSGGGNDVKKICSFQRGTTNQAAVNVGLGQQLCRVGGIHAAAVQQRHLGSSAVGLHQLRPQSGMHRLGLFGRGGFTGANGPDWLVGNDQAGHILAHHVQHSGQLALHHGFGFARFALRGFRPGKRWG